MAAVQSDRRGAGGLAPTPVAIAAIQADRAGTSMSMTPTGRPSLDSLKFPMYPLESSSPSMVPRPSYESAGFRSSNQGGLADDETTSSGSNENSETPLSLVSPAPSMHR